MLTLPALTLVQWLSPAFPTGAFAYSHGMETAIASGVVHDADTVQLWLGNLLQFGAGWQDAVLLSVALESGEYDRLDTYARALAPSAERLQESDEQGAAFARTVAGMTGRDLPARMLPVAVAEAAAPLALPPADVAALYLQAWVGNLCTVATRHVPLGQTAAQAALAALGPLILTVSQRAATAGLDDLGGCALGADMSALHHETQEVRIFRT